MRVLAYEVRRLLGLRSTWLILVAALAADAAVAAVASRQAAPGPLPVAEAVRLVTAAVPLLPVPLAALAAGALGALGSAHEVRHPGLAASQVRYLTRLRLLAGKLAVLGAVAAVLAVLSLAVDALVIRIALPSGTLAARLYAPVLLRADQRPLLLLVTFTALVVAGAWTGVLASALTRSAAAGLLLLCALPTLVEPVAGALLRRAPASWVARAEQALPFQHGGYGQHGLDQLHEPLMAAALLAPVALLLTGCLLALTRRRSL